MDEDPNYTTGELKKQLDRIEAMLAELLALMRNK